MPKIVVDGAKLSCAEGMSSASLSVSDASNTTNDKPTATVNDFVPNKNIPPFGQCKTLANPQVASATAAANGVLTPQPCVPVVTAPWSPGSAVSTINGVKVLTVDSTCTCTWTGTIKIEDAGQGGAETD